ncbi:MAG: class I SAM-dependent DNA methyltransferase [Polyangiales bacterium]
MSIQRQRAQPKTTSTAAGERRQIERAVQRSLRHGTAALYEDALFFDHFYRRRSADVKLYVELARRYGGPVLELGVGTGRIAIAIARAGIEVVGVDVMPSMLARARQRTFALPLVTRGLLTLRRGDMRRLALGRRFPLVIAPFNAFTHLYTRDDVERTLACCRRHLEPRGRLAFDVVMPDLRALHQDPDRLYRGRDVRDPRDSGMWRYHEASHYDAARQIRSVTMLFERKDDPRRTRAVPLTQRQFFPSELEGLLHYNGFEIEQRYGDFRFGPLRESSETQVLVARPA